MALKTPYATVSQANSYLSTDDNWLDLDPSVQEAHLLNGRYFIDSNYECVDIDELAIPEELVYANSLLAQIDMQTGLFTVSENGNSPVVKKMVKAGSVESETTYAGSRSTSLRLNGIDLYPQVTSILDEYCTYTKSSSVTVSSLLRA